VRRRPDGLARLGAGWAAKSVAAAGVVGGIAVALALPVDASPASLTFATPAASAAADRSAPPAASRSRARSERPAALAVAAPAQAAPVGPERVGVSGVRAVAKPKPKPKPKPQPEPQPRAEDTSAASDHRSSSSSSSDRSSRSGTSSNSSSTSRSSASSYSRSISGRCGNLGLDASAARLCSAVDSVFHLHAIGGFRANAGEHGTGQAVDLMISGRSQGDAVAAWVQAHVGEFDVKYIIWRQRYWEPGSSWDPMEDRGSPTANHMDHVHVTVN
jgi:hypothetical protein